jgi:hypothetical protein
MEKISAVEWLEEKWNKYDLNLGKSGFSLLLKQAKEMEKQHIVDSFEIGYENGACVNEGESIYHGHNYYKKTFKSE